MVDPSMVVLEAMSVRVEVVVRLPLPVSMELASLSVPTRVLVTLPVS